ncbi:MAG: HEAT repeat domain-containing protein [bacterium]|nr:HEAT repeat domain-containing protein [bacterium]
MQILIPPRQLFALGAWVVFLTCLAPTLVESSSHAQVQEKSIAELIEQLDVSNLEQRRDAVYELVRRQATEHEVMVALAELVDDRDEQIRFQALMGLARAGAQAEPAIEGLLECLENRDDQIRYRASVALGKIGVSAMPKLLQAWTDASSQMKVGIARGFSLIGAEAVDALPALRKSLQQDQGEHLRFVAEAIRAIQPSDEGMLLELANNASELVRIVGVSALAALENPSPKVAQQLRQALGDQDPKIRETAILALAKSGLARQEKSGLILQMLSDDDHSVREAAIVAVAKADLKTADFSASLAGLLRQRPRTEIGNSLVKCLLSIGTEAEDALTDLLAYAASELDGDASGDLDQEQLAQAAAALGTHKIPELLATLDTQPKLKPIVSQALALAGNAGMDSLIDAMNNDREIVRATAVQAIGGIRPLEAGLLARLNKALSDPSALVRRTAVESLLRTAEEVGGETLLKSFASGDDPRAQLSKAITDNDASVRAAAIPVLALLDFNPEKVREYVTRGMRDGSPEVRLATLKTIGSLKQGVSDNLDSVLQLTEDEVASVRAQALAALGELEAEGSVEGVAAALVRGLTDEDTNARSQATRSVAKLELSDPDVLAALSNNLGDDRELLEATLGALEVVGPKASSLAAAVSQLVEHPADSVRQVAINTYAAIQADKSVLTGRLIDALNDKEWTVRKVAAERLAEIGPAAKAAVPRLFELLGSEDDSDSASNAIREIDAAPSEAMSLFMDNLDSDDRRTRFYAMFLLGKIGPQASAALPRLEAMLQEAESEGGSEFRTRFLKQAIASIKGEEEPDSDEGSS